MLLSYALIIVFLSPVNFAQQIGDKLFNITVTRSLEKSKNQLVYTNRIELFSQQTAIISIDAFNNDHFGFATLQIHSFYYNITIFDGQNSYYGSNNGFIIMSDNSSKVLHLINKNHNSINCMIALIAYNNHTPIPGACSMEVNSTTSNLNNFYTNENENFLVLTIPGALEPHAVCENSDLTYETYYTYIDPLNFEVESFFEALETMIFSGIFSTYPTKNLSNTRTHLFEAIAGRGLIVNTAVKSKSGETSYYTPYSTYSCPKNTWKTHCSDISFLKRAVSVVLVIHSVVMMLNLMVPDFIEAIMNGMLYGGFFTIALVQSNNLPIQHFDYFIVIIVIGLFSGALLGTISMYIPIGRYLSKLTLCNIFMAFIVECWFDNVTSIAFQTLLAFIFSVVLSYSNITYSAFLGGLILILNASYLVKIGNLHRIIINNFLAFISVPSYVNDSFYDYIRPNYINYRVVLNTVDYVLIVLYIIVSIYLTIRKERYFFENPAFANADNFFSNTSNVDTYNCENARRRRENCLLAIRQDFPSHYHRIISRNRRMHRVRPDMANERSPILSHWLNSEEGDDDVFETPQSARYLEILTGGNSDLTYNDSELNAVENMEV